MSFQCCNNINDQCREINIDSILKKYSHFSIQHCNISGMFFQHSVLYGFFSPDYWPRFSARLSDPTSVLSHLLSESPRGTVNAATWPRVRSHIVL